MMSLQKSSIKHSGKMLTLFRIGGEEGGGKLRPQNFLTFSFNPFATLL